METTRLAATQNPEVRTEEAVAGTDTQDAYRVVLFNDDVHTFDEVIFQIIKAVRCTRAKAEKHTWEVHNNGRSVVYSGSIVECLRVSAVLEEIALKTEIQTG
ncbi:MAG: ATP-dependent Clp protease adaptor ClpS [Chlorobiaceae bacterium]|nr:ATP-dependent Clp protease adaptor ClpS [Chlorobiaceae bacterium]